MTKGLDFEGRVVTRVQSELNFIAADNYTKNFSFCNLADVLTNLLGNLSPILIYSFDNIFAFYYWLFTYLIAKLLSNTVSTNFSYLSFDLIKVEWRNCFSCSPSIVSALLYYKKIYSSLENSFLNRIYLLACIKHTFLYVCN